MASTRALLVAINDNGSQQSNLPSCLEDAYHFRSLLGERYRFDQFKEPYDNDATFSNAEKGPTRLFEGVTLLRSTFALAIVLAAVMASSALAQTPSDLKARCDQLTSYYDRYGVGRSENSDGARNHTRIAAGIDCQQGQYEKGISTMEALLKSKNFDVPPVPTGVAQPPTPLKPRGEKRRVAQ